MGRKNETDYSFCILNFQYEDNNNIKYLSNYLKNFPLQKLYNITKFKTMIQRNRKCFTLIDKQQNGKKKYKTNSLFTIEKPIYCYRSTPRATFGHQCSNLNL